MKKLRMSCISAAALTLSVTAVNASTELITNGSFETGLTGWSCSISGDASCTTSTSHALDGFRNFLGYQNYATGTLTQSVSTVIGQTYDFSFWSFVSYDVPENLLSYSFGSGPEVFAVTTTSYAQTTDSFVATSGTTEINLFFRTGDGLGAWRVDDVSLVESALPAVPVPAGMPLVLSGLAAFGLMARKRKS